MLSAGAGRGRGWMKLEKNTELCRPGDDFKKFDPPGSKLPVQKSICYDDLVLQFECLNSEDDGILLNEKFKHIRGTFMSTCETEEEITKAMIAIHQKCLTNGEFLKKFISFISSAFFFNMQNSKAHLNWRTIVRKCFINHLQTNFENRELLREKKPEIFYNCLELHMNFFQKFRIIHPYGYPTIEAAAVSGYLQTLLEHKESTDIRMFLNMVCENREMLINLYNKNELVGLLNKLKKTLISDDKLSTNQKLLLFFSWDLIRHKFNLSAEEIKFYMDHMEEEYAKQILVKYSYLLGMTNAEVIKETKNELQHHAGLQEKSLNDSLKLSTTVESSSSLHQDNAVDQYRYSTSLNNAVCDNEDVSSISRVSNSQGNISNYEITSAKNDRWENADNGKIGRTDFSNMTRQKPISNEKIHNAGKQIQTEKVGRPILGIGARLKRNC